LVTEKEGEVYEIAEKMHNSLVGNQDYIDSNIVLNFDNSADPIPEKRHQKATLTFMADDCQDTEYIRKKAKEAIDIFIENLKKKE